jgi:hypothetical protein
MPLDFLKPRKLIGPEQYPTFSVEMLQVKEVLRFKVISAQNSVPLHAEKYRYSVPVIFHRLSVTIRYASGTCTSRALLPAMSGSYEA